MSDYKKMYLKLFNKVTDVIKELEEVQRQTEELYIQVEVMEIILCERDADKQKTHPAK